MNTLSRKIIIFGLLSIFFTNLNAQDQDNPWVIGFGINAVDFYPTNINGMVSETGVPTQWFDQFFNLKDNYNYIVAPSKLSIGRYINKHINLELALSINKLTKLGAIIKENESWSYFAADVNVNYDINNIVGQTGSFDPYAIVGGGLNIKESDAAPSLNSGLGTKFWFSEKFGVKMQSVYKHFFNDGSFPHFQHSASLIYKFGGFDGDNDGIYDKDDKCPEQFGLKEFNGCPDSDEDGTPDSEDECPDVYGPKNLKGCPDSDGDGIADKNDACPYIVGIAKRNGCPDADDDGVIDQRDACPNVAGPASNRGCPEPDTDKDGVIDRLDKCKYEPGIAANDGCPDFKIELEKKLTELASEILFMSGSDYFYQKYNDNLDQIADLMKEHGDLKYEIQGHTDDVGPAEANLKLSLRRVNKVLNYLVSQGVNQFNLSVKGYGEEKPIDTNDTAEGRARNRRVEIKVIE